MLPDFERWARSEPQSLCLYFAEEQGALVEYTVEDMRMRAASLALQLSERGIARGDVVIADMDNCPAFVALVLAAAYGGFTLGTLNVRLSESQKDERVAQVREASSSWTTKPNILCMTEEAVENALAKGSQELSALRHFAERAAALFNDQALSLIMFTSGVTGRAKAAALTWDTLSSAAQAFNASIAANSDDRWQAALPLYHIGGFQILVRSFLNRSPFILYRKFEPQRVLNDSVLFSVTHLSVVDKMLQDLLLCDGEERALVQYHCILLGGGVLNPKTVKEIKAKRLSVYASFGMTETASNIALKRVTKSFSGELALLPGYEVQIIMPDEQGRGQLAVRGPGVFSGYLNTQTPLTGDGYFLTGDRASIGREGIVLYERTSDMFVSGGENIYPAEIEAELKGVLGARDASVFGVKDMKWGRRPVAFLEAGTNDEKEHAILRQRAQQHAQVRLAHMYRPRDIFVLEELPRIGIGKIDREALSQKYDERIEIQEITLYHVEQELVRPFITAQTHMTSRTSLIIEVKDTQGRTGLGECVAFETDWYLPETLAEDAEVLENKLIPLALESAFLHPRDMAQAFDACLEGRFPLARGALEPAMWDLYGKIVGQPLWQLIGGMLEKSTTVPVGITFGIMSVEDTLDAVGHAVLQGYTRVKIKVKPGNDIERVRAIRKEFPRLVVVLDANQSYCERDQGILRKLDEYGIYCIEEPLAPHKNESTPAFFRRLADLQKSLKMRVCLDESIVTSDDLEAALSVHELTCFALKIAKLGGIQAALNLYRIAQEQGIELWMGGMYETSVSKRMHAAFQTLPGIDLPGDLSATLHYFRTEIASPPFVVEKGQVRLNESGYEYGLGCSLNEDVLERVTTEKQVFTRKA